mgnify:FL=1
MSKTKTFEKKTLVGISTKDITDAIASAIQSFGKDQVSWFEVTEIRGRVDASGEIEYQVTINIGTKINAN